MTPRMLCYSEARIDDVGKEQAPERSGPFVAKSEFPFPNLYAEIVEMMEANAFIYPLFELRRKERENSLEKLSDDEMSLLKLPLTHREITDALSVISRASLKGTRFASNEFYQGVFKNAERRHAIQRQESSDGNRLMINEISKDLSPAVIIAFDDELEKEKLVYAIEVNHPRQRITVTFRGSITKSDKQADFEIAMKKVRNPLSAYRAQPESFRLHSGFYRYLFRPSHRGYKGPDGKVASEFEEIVQKHLLPLFKSYPSYKLYVTGHSLGAALSTLFGFECAAMPDDVFPKPVSVFSFAGPYVGDGSFRAAHTLLEQQGKLRHLRVTNHQDIVTTIPKVAFQWNVFDRESHVGALFKHVGMHMRLFANDHFHVSYPKVLSTKLQSHMNELRRGITQCCFAQFHPNFVRYWRVHGLIEYNRRTQNKKESLSKLYLNDLYANEKIVGLLTPQL